MSRSLSTRNELNFSWLLRLRWGSMLGQIATIVVVAVFVQIELPLLWLGTVIGLEFLSNIAASLWFRKRMEVYEWHLAGLMALDVALLTALLYFTGGPSNPFSFLYLVNIALAAVVLHAHWTWMLVAFTLFSFGLLPRFDYWPLALEPKVGDAGANLHQQGSWVAFGVAAGFIVYFLWRVTGDLARREQELSEARDRATRQQQMTSLATMAAGAAHELATPLGTIALVAKELERQDHGGNPEALDDIKLIRSQVTRCRSILDQMAGSMGKSSEDALEVIQVDELVADAMTGVRPEPAILSSIDDQTRQELIEIVPHALSQALRNILTNAQDASPKTPVSLSAIVENDRLDLIVTDQGSGMPADVLRHCVDPFFTTKEPGRGMGLGLFLTQSVIEGLNGELTIDSSPLSGTSVRVSIPLRPTPLKPSTLNRHQSQAARQTG